MVSGIQESNACSLEPGTMPAQTFREQLDSLAAEYGLLQEENRQLRARLFQAACPRDRNKFGCDVEFSGSCHQLIPEALHLALPSGMKTDESDEEGSVIFGSPPPPDGKLTDLQADAKNPSMQTQGPRFTIDLEALWKDNGHDAGTESKNRHEDLRRRPIFANAEDMKERVRQKLTKPSYNVMDYYKTTGISQEIARNQSFETVTLVVIGLNAFWIWIDTDYNNEDNLINAHPVFQVAEHFFCLYFFLEISVRFLAFKYKTNCLKDGWFVFDSFLVLVMVFETWMVTLFLLATNSSSKGTAFGDASVLRMVRLLRLLRMGRMARLLRAMPELVILIKGMVAAARSVFFTLVLLVILLYIFAIACTQLLKETLPGDVYFKNVPVSMHTLWLRGALLDEVVEVMAEIEKVSLMCLILLDIFILAAALTVMNMLVGVLCEVVSAVAASEKEEIDLTFVKSKVEKIFNDFDIDKDNNKRITKEEFVQIIDNHEAARAIQAIGVDVVALVDFAEVFFSTEEDDELYNKELSFAEFMEAVVSLRGSNVATVRDIMDLRKTFLQQLSRFEKQLHGVQEALVNSHAGGQNSPSVSSLANQNGGEGAAKRHMKKASRGASDSKAATKPNGTTSSPTGIAPPFDSVNGNNDAKLRSAASFSSVPKPPKHPLNQDAIAPPSPSEGQASSTSPSKDAVGSKNMHLPGMLEVEGHEFTV